MRGCVGVWLAAISLSGCVTDIPSGFDGDSVSAGGTGGVDTMPPASTAPGDTGTTQGQSESTTTDATAESSSGSLSNDDSGTTDVSTDTQSETDSATGTTGDPCDPDPCDAPMACLEGECVGAAAPAAGDVVISELHPDPDAVADDNGEWLELWVVGDSAVDLQGCELADEGTDNHEIAVASLIVQPDARVLMGKNESSVENGGVMDIAYAYGGSFSLANGGDEVVLRCGGVVIDTLSYSGSWPFSAGVAAQLDPAANTANNDDVNMWCPATTAFGSGDFGTPGAPNDPC